MRAGTHWQAPSHSSEAAAMARGCPTKAQRQTREPLRHLLCRSFEGLDNTAAEGAAQGY